MLTYFDTYTCSQLIRHAGKKDSDKLEGNAKFG